MKKIAYIGGIPYPQSFAQPWGGTTSTNYCYQKSFENDPEYRLFCLPRVDIANPTQIEKFIEDVQPDIVHLDDTGVCGVMFKGGLKAPDFIGPMTRSPTKLYKNKWKAPYSEEWFYSATVLRLNHFEERKTPDRVVLIDHGVDSEMLVPKKTPHRNIILWAGQKDRPAKNFGLWTQIQRGVPPPKYQYRTMSMYNVEDYWKVLDQVALIVNTSKSETFCCAAFEAMSKGVPVVWRKNLQGGVHEDAGIRVEYDADSYHLGIKAAVKDLARHSVEARDYVKNHCTLKHMRDSYVKVFAQHKS